MQQRQSIDRNAIAIERFAIDNNDWKVFLALHYGLKHSLDAGNSNISSQLEICRKLIEQGQTETSKLLDILLYKVVEGTQSTAKGIKELFGDDVVRNSAMFSRKFENINMIVEFHENTFTDGSIKQVLTEERYSLNRDGVFLENYAIEKGFWRTLVALHYANKRLFGLYRRDDSNEIDHATTIACRTFDRGIYHDIITASILTHDVPENAKNNLPRKKGISEEEYELEKILYYLTEIKEILGARVAYNVDCLTKRPGLSLWKYFQRIIENKDASVIKSVDKETIICTMIKIFSVERMQRQLKEMDDHFLDVMKDARKRHKEHVGLFFSCRENIKNMMNSVKKYIKVVLFVTAIIKRSETGFENFGNLQIAIQGFAEKIGKKYGSLDLKKDLENIKKLSQICDNDIEEVKILNKEFLDMTRGI